MNCPRRQAFNYWKFNILKYFIATLILIVTFTDGEELSAGQQAQGGRTADVEFVSRVQMDQMPSATLGAETQQHQIVDSQEPSSDEKEQAIIEEGQKIEEKEHEAMLARINDDTGHNGKRWEVSMHCRNCLCYFATDCDLKRQCETPFSVKGLEAGMDKGDCGPFHISLPFWADGNKEKLVLGDAEMEDKWRKCSLDLLCATESIQKYFHKYPIDCNKDGKVDCIDYAAIHTLGPFGCQEEEKLAWWNKKRRLEMVQCMVKHEEGVYTKQMHMLEEKLKLQDIAARKNAQVEDNKNEETVKSKATTQVKHKLHAEEVDSKGNVEKVKDKETAENIEPKTNAGIIDAHNHAHEGTVLQ